MKEKREISAKQKLEIVLEGLRNETSISVICRKHGIATVQYYIWRDQLLEGSNEIFNRKCRRKDNKDERYKEKVDRLTNVITEISTENVELKKELETVLEEMTADKIKILLDLEIDK